MCLATVACLTAYVSRDREFDRPSPIWYFSGVWSWNYFYAHSPPFRWIIQEGFLLVFLKIFFEKKSADDKKSWKITQHAELIGIWLTTYQSHLFQHGLFWKVLRLVYCRSSFHYYFHWWGWSIPRVYEASASLKASNEQIHVHSPYQHLLLVLVYMWSVLEKQVTSTSTGGQNWK